MTNEYVWIRLFCLLENKMANVKDKNFYAACETTTTDQIYLIAIDLFR